MSIKSFFEDRGFLFSEKFLYNLYIALKSKPFAVMYGISGTGKSKVVEILAEYVIENRGLEPSQFFLPVAVKPDWISTKDLLGFYNPLKESYIRTNVLDFILKANSDRKNPYFLLLDEMNLSHIEYYFADFLSALESRRYSKVSSDGGSEVDYDKICENLGTLSEAALLAAFILIFNDDHDRVFKLEELRNTPIVEKWKALKSEGENWTAQFRSEFNQRDKDGNPSRKAGKWFDAVENEKGVYKLKEKTDVTEYLAIWNKVETLFNNSLSNNSIEQHEIALHSEGEGLDVPENIKVPLNLYIIGTINLDETTKMLSPKVLDRANLLEVNEVIYPFVYKPEETEESVDYFQHEVELEPISAVATIKDVEWLNANHVEVSSFLIKEINETLKKYNKHVGFRTINDISFYIRTYEENLESPDKSHVFEALDNQIAQKILIKFNGTSMTLLKPVDNLLEVIMAFHNQNGNCLPKSVKKLEKILENLETYGHANFIET